MYACYDTYSHLMYVCMYAYVYVYVHVFVRMYIDADDGKHHLVCAHLVCAVISRCMSLHLSYI